jgi:hypothetical protein
VQLVLQAAQQPARALAHTQCAAAAPARAVLLQLAALTLAL